MEWNGANVFLRHEEPDERRSACYKAAHEDQASGGMGMGLDAGAHVDLLHQRASSKIQGKEICILTCKSWLKTKGPLVCHRATTLDCSYL